MFSTFRQYKLQTKIMIAVLSVACLIFLLVEAQGEDDFRIYISAAHDLFSGVNIYSAFYSRCFHYLYSVSFAMLLYPFSFLPFHLVKFCWLLLNAFWLYRVFKVVFSFFNLSSLSEKQRRIFYTVTFLFALRFIYENFHNGQITILILYTCVQGLYWIFYTDKWAWGCVLIAIGINIKLLPLVLLPYLLYRRKFKAFGLVVLSDAVLWLLPALIFGIERNADLVSEWWSLVNPSNKIHVLDVSERSFHSLGTLLSTLFVKDVPDIFALPLRRHIADVSLQTLGIIITCARGILIAGTLYFLRSWPFKPALSKTQQYLETAYILAIVPLIFPHQQHYAFLFIVPAAVYIIYYTICNYKSLSKTQRLFLFISGAFIYLFCNLKLILGEYNLYYEHYKILTYGALWLLVILVFTRKYLQEPLNAPPAS